MPRYGSIRPQYRPANQLNNDSPPTIFSEMSALAVSTGAVNLGQGFPDFDCDPRLLDAVNQAMRSGHNQYPPMPGVPALREAIAEKMEYLYDNTAFPEVWWES